MSTSNAHEEAFTSRKSFAIHARSEYMVVAINWNETAGKLNFKFPVNVPTLWIEFIRWNILSAAPHWCHVDFLHFDFVICTYFARKWFFGGKRNEKFLLAVRMCRRCYPEPYLYKNLLSSLEHYSDCKHFNCVCLRWALACNMHADERNSSWQFVRFSLFYFLLWASRCENVRRDITVDNNNANDNLSTWKATRTQVNG